MLKVCSSLAKKQVQYQNDMNVKPGVSNIFWRNMSLNNLLLFLLLICLVAPSVSAHRLESREIGKGSSATPQQNPTGANKNIQQKNSGPTTKIPPATTSKPSANSTNDVSHVKGNIPKWFGNTAMLYRAMYVLLAVTAVVVIYFVIKAIRLRKRKSKSRKYGIITKQDRGGMELEPLGDGMDEDDDYTVFEMNRKN